MKILDIGSGPRSWLGNQSDSFKVKVVCADPLAEVYTSLYAKHGLRLNVPIIKVGAERLRDVFPFRAFDVVTARNCLDHSYSPETCILQAAHCVKTAVYLIHQRNVAKEENYQGLHQWNFDIQNGDFVIWNKDKILNFSLMYSHLFDIACITSETVWEGVKQHWVIAALTKRNVCI